MVQVNRVCLKILFINRPQFLVDSNGLKYKHVATISNMKYAIARKMGVPFLDDFIRPYQEEYRNSLK